VNWRVFIGGALELLRQLLLKSLGMGVEVEEIESLADMEEIKVLIGFFDRAGRELKEAFIPQLPVELAVAEYCQEMKGAESEQQSIQSNSEGKKGKNEVGKKPVKLVKRRLMDKSLVGRWGKVMTALRPQNHSLEGLLRSTRPLRLADNVLEVEVFYQFHLDQLRQPRFLALVEGALAEVFANQLKVKYILGRRPPKAKKEQEIENVSGKVEEDVVKVAEEIFGA
jgi:hypothetical protein